MLAIARALRQLPLPLWIVAAAGLLTGATFAQEAAARSAEVATIVAASAGEPEAVGEAAAPAPAVPTSTIRFRDSEPPVTAERAAEPPRASIGFGRLAVVLAVLIAALGALAYLKRRGRGLGGPSARKELSLLGSLRLGGRAQVLLVRVPGRTLVLGSTEKGLNLLSTLDDDELLEASDDPDQAYAAFTAAAREAAPVPRHHRGAADPTSAPPAPPEPSSVPDPTGPDAFLGKLLDQLGQRSPVRDRPKTPQAEALRARLERHQRLAG